MVVEGREVLAQLAVAPDWTEGQLRAAADSLADAQLALVARPENLLPLRDFLVSQREFLVRLLENPVLLEHESFTDLLWAVFHLEEELSARASLTDLPAADLEHLAGDSHRAYAHLLRQWLAYMLHLKRMYPFLFSFEARTNPLRPGATAEITAA
jgi:Rad3-related DNA helicase